LSRSTYIYIYVYMAVSRLFLCVEFLKKCDDYFNYSWIPVVLRAARELGQAFESNGAFEKGL
jgi:hypothetical protein